MNASSQSHLFPSCLRQAFVAVLCGLLLSFGGAACAQGGAWTPRQAQLPDPRFRRPFGLGELQHIVQVLAASNALQVRIAVVEDRSGQVGMAQFQGTALSGSITVNPLAVRSVPPNTWAFIFGHELAHAVDGLAQMRPGAAFKAVEWAADEIGATYARRAGFSLEAHLAWVFSRPDGGGPSHGTDHERATRLGNLHRIPPASVHRLRPCYGRPLP